MASEAEASAGRACLLAGDAPAASASAGRFWPLEGRDELEGGCVSFSVGRKRAQCSRSASSTIWAVPYRSAATAARALKSSRSASDSTVSLPAALAYRASALRAFSSPCRNDNGFRPEDQLTEACQKLCDKRNGMHT